MVETKAIKFYTIKSEIWLKVKATLGEFRP